MADEDNENPVPGEHFTPEPEEGNGDGGGNGADGGAMEQPALVINGQYIKDFSFEAPNTPEVFNHLQNEMPNIQVDIDVQSEGKGDNLFEVVLKVRVEAKVKENLAYICELSYAGFFSINVPPEHLGPVLLIECPLILFPFLRRIMADSTGDGGFTPFMLSPIDFASLYQQRMAQVQAQAEAEANGEGSSDNS